MIAIVFIVAIGLLIGGASLFGVQVSSTAAASVPWWALASVLAAFIGFFAEPKCKSTRSKHGRPLHRCA